MENTSRNSKKEMLTNRKTYFFRTSYGVRSFSMSTTVTETSSVLLTLRAKKEYNYEYEGGRIVRATEVDIELSGGKTMSAFG